MTKSRAIELIKTCAIPLKPLPPELPPEWEKLVVGPDRGSAPNSHGDRAVLFDLYGTLFISAAGDIAVGDTGIEFEDAGETEEYALGAMRSFFTQAVRERHEGSKKTYPEVLVEEIWDSYGGPLPPAWLGEEPLDPEEIALRYELRINPVYPMPGALETITSLQKAGLVLGVISNAQFFSPLLFDSYFGASLEELGFDPDLLIYSFKMGEAKPSARLFERAAARLAALGIQAGEVLYVGNDMLKDIVPAQKAGFRTALFAGDRRSLRLREEEGQAPEIRGSPPDLVLRDLQSLLPRR
jgi:putative hydrolase of the HAD superfamily